MGGKDRGVSIPEFPDRRVASMCELSDRRADPLPLPYLGPVQQARRPPSFGNCAGRKDRCDLILDGTIGNQQRFGRKVQISFQLLLHESGDLFPVNSQFNRKAFPADLVIKFQFG
jgi:hypothetical protein